MKGLQHHRFLDNEDSGLGGWGGAENRGEESQTPANNNLLLSIILISFSSAVAASSILASWYLSQRLQETSTCPPGASIHAGAGRPEPWRFHRPPEACPAAQTQGLYESHHWCLLCSVQAQNERRPCAARRCSPDPGFNVMGNVMVLSLCSIVNSVTILWGIN